jgi:hypothetical protein
MVSSWSGTVGTIGELLADGTLSCMPRSRVLTGALAAVLAVAFSLVAPLHATAGDADSCHGQPATIVGAGGAFIEGTDGPDVIVTNGASSVRAGAGDDTVCVTVREAEVHADGGDDVVDASAVSDGSIVQLGLGDDSFAGGPGPDLVAAGKRAGPTSGQGSDTVSTGPGDDIVTTGGTAAAPDHDRIDLGAGRDVVRLFGAVDPDFPIIGGADDDELRFERQTLRQRLVINNATGRATRAGVPVMRWNTVENFRLRPFRGAEPPVFIGGKTNEIVWAYTPLASAHLGGGNDWLDLLTGGRLAQNARYEGGAGADRFLLPWAFGTVMARRVELDLVTGSLLARTGKHTARGKVLGFEVHKVAAHELEVRGTPGRDRVKWQGCHGEVNGGAGRDLLKVVSVSDDDCGRIQGSKADLVARGGPGNDTLLGDWWPDILIGGPGRDVADGATNTDRCQAETKRNCER